MAAGSDARGDATSTCRFYQDRYPKAGDLVMVQPEKLDELGYYARLLEYNNLVGFQAIEESSCRRPTRSMGGTMFGSAYSRINMRRIGRLEVWKVLRVDYEKGFLDLSKRQVKIEEAVEKEQVFSKAKAVHSILRTVAKDHSVDVEDLCRKVSWPLHQNGDAFSALRRHFKGEDDVFAGLNFGADAGGKDLSSLKDVLQASIMSRFKHLLIQAMIKLKAKIEVSCAGSAGIDGVKRALGKGAAISRADCSVEIKLVSHPSFLVTVRCLEAQDGHDTLDKALKLIRQEIQLQGGVFCNQTSEGRLDSDTDDGDAEH
jgi:translation initiation factor 2 subunit 1